MRKQWDLEDVELLAIGEAAPLAGPFALMPPSGRVAPCLMEESLALPGGAGRLLLVPASDGYCSALTAERTDGAEAWSAYPPDGDNDAWVAVRIDDSTVLATSYSGWLIRLDPESGHETERQFAK